MLTIETDYAAYPLATFAAHVVSLRIVVDFFKLVVGQFLRLISLNFHVIFERRLAFNDIEYRTFCPSSFSAFRVPVGNLCLS